MSPDADYAALSKAKMFINATKYLKIPSVKLTPNYAQVDLSEHFSAFKINRGHGGRKTFTSNHHSKSSSKNIDFHNSPSKRSFPFTENFIFLKVISRLFVQDKNVHGSRRV